MNGRKKVLLITSVFPPSWGSGVHRVSKLYKYLHAFGYFPFVLTTREDSYGIIDHSMDKSLEKGRVMRLRVINWKTFSRTGGAELFNKNVDIRKKSCHLFVQFLRNIYNIVSIPDDRVLWIPIAIMKGYWTIKKHEIGLLFSTSPHSSCHIVALSLNRLTHIPWIADFRDAWVENPFYLPPFRFCRFVDQLLEKWVVKYSSKVLSISEPITEGLRKRYPEFPLNKFDVLTNSFDPDDFIDLKADKNLPNKFIISHAGTFYGKRSPESLLLALRKLLDERPNWRDRIEVLFIGSSPQNGETLNLLKPLRDVVRFVSYLPYRDMLRLLVRSSILLLIPGPGKGTVTSKVFDYLALKKPILLLSQENTALENMLRKTKNGFIVPYRDIDGIVECLTMFIQEFFNTGTVKMETSEEEIGHFTSIEMTKKLVKIMNEL